ncbi:MAG: DUF86 domain-containing protein [Rhodocyclaceae bacterium]|nr:DUF86 domain-containing protein [Rhodocyclaceae bacterium]
MKTGYLADKVYVRHMVECIERVAEFCAADEGRFRASRLIQDAVVRNLQTLTESSQRLSEELKATEPDIPWRGLAGFRNVLVHDYLGVDLDVVWRIVTDELPRLKAALERMAQNGPATP